MSDLSSNPLLGLFKNACHYGLFLLLHGQLLLGTGHLVTQLVKNLPAMQVTPVTPVWFLEQEDPLEKGWLPIPYHSVFLGFLGGSAGKECACDAGDPGSIPGLGRSPGEGNCYPLQYSGLENLMDCIVHGVAKRWTQPSDFHFHFFHLQIIFKAEMTLPHKVSLKVG